jgi:hypothetical protein
MSDRIISFEKKNFEWWEGIGAWVSKRKDVSHTLQHILNQKDTRVITKRIDGHWGFCDENGVEWKVVWDGEKVVIAGMPLSVLLPCGGADMKMTEEQAKNLTNIYIGRHCPRLKSNPTFRKDLDELYEEYCSGKRTKAMKWLKEHNAENGIYSANPYHIYNQFLYYGGKRKDGTLLL